MRNIFMGLCVIGGGRLYSRLQKGVPLRGRLYKRVVFAGAQGAIGGNGIPESKRVQAPSAPGFKHSPGCRPGMLGVGPQSGLVQRGVIKYRGRQQTGCILKCKRGAPLRGRLYRRVMFASLKGRWGGKRYSRKQEGSGAFGARVLSVMC